MRSAVDLFLGRCWGTGSNSRKTARHPGHSLHTEYSLWLAAPSSRSESNKGIDIGSHMIQLINHSLLHIATRISRNRIKILRPYSGISLGIPVITTWCGGHDPNLCNIPNVQGVSIGQQPRQKKVPLDPLRSRGSNGRHPPADPVQPICR